MTTTRVWLTEWEWGCCGDAFTCGDEVALTVSREVAPWLAELLGPELAADVGAVESHHVDPAPERLRGVVIAIHGVAVDHSERREPRPDHQPPPQVLRSRGDGVWASLGPHEPYVTIREPIPGTARLHAAPGVPWPARDELAPVSAPPPGLTGYFVDLDVG